MLFLGGEADPARSQSLPARLLFELIDGVAVLSEHAYQLKSTFVKDPINALVLLPSEEHVEEKEDCELGDLGGLTPY